MDDTRPGLRERHTELTRETILHALVEIVAEGGLPDFSVQQVADRSGVSHRTIYRHFPSREDLLNGLMDWVESRMVEVGAHFGAADGDELLVAMGTNLGVFDTLAELVESLARLSLATGHEPPQRRDRNDMFVDILERDLAGDDPEQVRAVAAVLRMLAGTRAWLVLRQDGITPRHHVAPALVWAAEMLLEAARDGRLPALHTTPSQPT